MKNLKLIVAYDGTGYLGWQKTEMGPSIEEELQKALQQILQHPVKLQAASRTDAGVHADAQVVNFFTSKNVVLDRLKKSMNGLLPLDIRILDAEIMPEGFHPTLEAKGKEYHYFICLGPTQLPFHRNFSWHFVKPVDIKKMKEAASFLIGKHDFSALTNEKQEDNVREVFHIEIEEMQPDRLRICVAGNHFLYKMVRNIVGTVVYAGCGMLTLEDVRSLLESRNRAAAGMTAPAHGLTLKKVYYD